MIHAVLLCAFAFGQDLSTTTVNAVEQIQLQNLAKDVRELQSGRPTITGVPYFINGATVGTVGLTFGDGTTQTTAASASAAAATILAWSSGTTTTSHNAESWVIVSGSSLTFTVSSGITRLRVCFNFPLRNTSTGGAVLRAMYDGVRITSPVANLDGDCGAYSGGAETNTCAACVTKLSPTAAAHTVHIDLADKTTGVAHVGPGTWYIEVTEIP